LVRKFNKNNSKLEDSGDKSERQPKIYKLSMNFYNKSFK